LRRLASNTSKPASTAFFLETPSGDAQPENVQKARDAGFDRHLAKPQNLEVLEHVLAEIPRSLIAT
jgi:CheY-like chemotaxis protein